MKKKNVRLAPPLGGWEVSVGFNNLLREFKPTLLFLSKFLAIYFILNIIYGIYVESYDTKADGITTWVSDQSVSFLSSIGYEASSLPVAYEPKVALYNQGTSVINIFEGCNGINIMILFLAFIVAVSGNFANMIWFIPAGFIFIHLANLGRIAFLFWVAQSKPDYLYFSHKYIFTAIIYTAVFLLWTIWVVRFSGLFRKH